MPCYTIARGSCSLQCHLPPLTQSATPHKESAVLRAGSYGLSLGLSPGKWTRDTDKKTARGGRQLGFGGSFAYMLDAIQNAVCTVCNTGSTNQQVVITVAICTSKIVSSIRSSVVASNTKPHSFSSPIPTPLSYNSRLIALLL